VVSANDRLGPPTGSLQGAPLTTEGRYAEAERLAGDGAAYALRLFPRLRVATEAVIGNATEALVRVSHDVGLVVVGSRGLDPATSSLLGSVAYGVGARCACPVVVVRDDGRRRPGPGAGVVVGVDGSPVSMLALESAADVAAAAGAPLTVVCAWHPPPASWVSAFWEVLGDESEEAQQERRHAEEVVRTAREKATARHTGLDVEGQVVAGPPARAIVRAARDAALLVVGSRRRGTLASIVLGSVGHGVVHDALCPVLIVHGDAEPSAEPSWGAGTSQRGVS
jgi:nucleotide-binding universal stress UspA family protein